jgi:hypothetical protein
MKTRNFKSALLGLSIATSMALTPAALAEDSQDERDVKAAVQSMWDAMVTSDGDTLKNLFLPEAQFYRVSKDPTKDDYSVTKASDFAEAVSSWPNGLLERTWDGKINVDGRMATYWAPFDMWNKDKFSHCGVDQMTFIKTGGHWRVANVTYTDDKSTCKPSPLGTPK